jgi:hypothetical protein
MRDAPSYPLLSLAISRPPLLREACAALRHEVAYERWCASKVLPAIAPWGRRV